MTLTVDRNLPDRRLLAVDDDADSAELIARISKRCGFEARHLTDPAQVAGMVRQWKPRIIVTDICMPDIDAFELMSILEFEAFDGEVIIVSGKGDTLREQACRTAKLRGMRVLGDMAKPIDIAFFKNLLLTCQAREAERQIG